MLGGGQHGRVLWGAGGETAIGLVFIWLGAATICSGLVELVATWLGFRANHLWQEIAGLFSREASGPETKGSFKAATTLATKPARSVDAGSPLAAFLAALPGVSGDALRRVQHIDPSAAAQAIANAFQKRQLVGTQVHRLIDALPDNTKDSPEQLTNWVEKWFNERMTALSASYRRRIRWWTVAAGVLVVCGIGLDSFGIAKQLYEDPAQRTVLVSRAEACLNGAVAANSTDSSSGPGLGTATAPVSGVGTPQATATTSTTVDPSRECMTRAAQEVGTLDLSAWQRHIKCAQWPFVIAGLLVSLGAVSAGAPFWFAVLKRLMTLRPKA